MKRFLISIALYTIFLILMFVDGFVISDLISTLIKTDNFIAIAMTAGFIAGIDMVPIFALTPVLSRRIKGISDQSSAENILIVAAIIIFVALESTYFIMSINYPGRFVIEGSTAIIDPDTSNLLLMSVITGLLPLITTMISMLFNFLLIGNEYVDREIDRCSEEKKKLETINYKLGAENILLDNLSDYVGLIQNHINNYKNGLAEFTEESVKKERDQMEHANIKAGEICWQEFNDFLTYGDKKFKEYQVLETSDGVNHYKLWQEYIRNSREFMEKKIDKVNV